MQTITITFQDPGECSRGFRAIDRLLFDMGQIGWISKVEAAPRPEMDATRHAILCCRDLVIARFGPRDSLVPEIDKIIRSLDGGEP